MSVFSDQPRQKSVSQLVPKRRSTYTWAVAHLRTHLHRKVILVHKNFATPIVCGDRLDMRQPCLNIIPEPLVPAIPRQLLNNLDHTSEFEHDLRVSPSPTQRRKRVARCTYYNPSLS